MLERVPGPLDGFSRSICILVPLFAWSWHAAACRAQAPSAEAVATRPAMEAPFAWAGRVDGAGLSLHSPFSQSGRAFVTRGKDSARVWDASTLLAITVPLRHEHLKLVRLSGNGKMVLTANRTEVRLWDVATSTLRSATTVTSKELRSANVAPNGETFATVSSDDLGAVAIWRAGTAQAIASLQHRFAVISAEFDPTGKRIVTHELGSDHPFHVWTAETAKEAWPPPESEGQSLNSDEYQPKFSPDGTRLLLPHQRGFAILDLATGKRLLGVRWTPGITTDAVRFGADASVVVTSTLDGLDPRPLQISDAASGAPQREVGTAGTFDCQIGPEGRWALCSRFMRRPLEGPELWDLASGRRVQTFPLRPGSEGSTEWLSPDGTLILIESERDSIEVWRQRPASPEVKLAPPQRQ